MVTMDQVVPEGHERYFICLSITSWDDVKLALDTIIYARVQQAMI